MKNNKDRRFNENIVILTGIASFTIIVVAGIWFFSGANTEANNSTAVSQSSDDMSSHHSMSSSRGSTEALDSLVDKPAPDFSLIDKDGKVYSKDSLKGKKIILFFNEGLMCYPACWQQIAELAADKRLNTEDIVALSVVVDSAKDWQRAIKKMPELAAATVLFDTKQKASNSFGVLTTPSSMHYGSLPGHTYVVIDKDSIVRHVYDDPAMAIHNDQLAEELGKLN